MASVEDLGDQFCRFSICYEYFKEPKQLPCLHRFCKHCLNRAFQESPGNPACPLCRTKIKLPHGGVDGLQTDFVFQELVEYVEKKNTHPSEAMRKCSGCNNILKVAAYCFQCNDFLCVKCYTHHGTNNSSKDHGKQLLTIERAESMNIAMEELDSFKDAPRCQSHPYNISELCCETCNKLLICSSCTEGDHKDHNCLEIEVVAKFERERLTLILQSLENMAHSKLAVTPGEVATRLSENAETEKDNFRKMYEKEVKKVNFEVSIVKQRKDKMESEKTKIKQAAFTSFRNEMDKAIEAITSKFEKLITEKDMEINEHFQSGEDITEKELNKLHLELAMLNLVKESFEDAIEKQLRIQKTNVDDVTITFDKEQKNFDELKFKASSIVDSPSKWVAAERTSDICKKCDALFRDFENFPDLERMSEVKVDTKHFKLLRKSDNTLSERELIIPIEGMKSHWVITDITGSDGIVVITGEHTLKKQSTIIVYDKSGSLIRQDTLKEKAMHHSRFCEFLSRFKVASVCQPNEIIIYDVRNGLYVKENLSRIRDWPSDCDVACVTTDRLNNRIFVGGESCREVFVFDDKLNLQHVLALPEMMKWPRDLAIYKDNLFLCDYDGQNAFVATVDPAENIILRTFELAKPDVGKTNLRPRSVCTDSDGFLYILWTSEKLFGRDRYIVSQYSKGDRQLMDTKQLDTDARCLSVMETDTGDKLVVASCDTFDVYTLVDST